MKNKLLAMVMCLLLTILSSCLPETRPPIGVWKSENPSIVLYVKPDYQRIPGHGSSYPVIYSIDGDEVKAFVIFGNGRRFTIYEMSARRADGVLMGDRWLFAGTFRIRNDELHYTLIPSAQERTGYEEIIFHRLEYYEPINSHDWWYPPTPPVEPPPPELVGTWESKSTEPNITLHFDASILHEEDGIFYGEYISNGNSINASVLFTRTHPTFLNIIFPREYGISPLGGNFRVVDDELHFTLLPLVQEETGYDIIVFQRLKDHNTITP